MAKIFDLFALEISKIFSGAVTEVIYLYMLDPRLYKFSTYLNMIWYTHGEDDVTIIVIWSFYNLHCNRIPS